MGFLVIDPLCGMAGDMLCAALLDLGAEKAQMLDIMRQAAVYLGGGIIRARSLVRHGTRGMLLRCSYPRRAAAVHSDSLKQGLRHVCDEHDINGKYRDYAERAFFILEQAEQAAHAKLAHEPAQAGVRHGHVHLHEAQDILVDIAGSAWGLQRLGVDLERVRCLAPVMVGGGEVRFSHGRFPVPAPAAAEIIASYRIPTAPGPFPTELFTPTGAALLAALGPVFDKRGTIAPGLPAGSTTESGLAIPATAGTGVGFGSKLLPHTRGTPANALYLYFWTG